MSTGTATGHSWQEALCESPKTCAVCGKTDSSALGHNWVEATCEMPRHCTRCSQQEGEPAAHTYDNEQDASCNVCGALREVTVEPPVDLPVPLSDFELEVLRLTNLERLAQGLNPLTATEALQKATDIRAEEVKGYFSHTRPNGSSCFTVLDDLDIPYGWAAENIAIGQRSPASVVADWMASEGHRANILTPELGHMGVGELKNAWVQLFTDAPAYDSIRVDIPEGTVFEAGSSIDEMDLVAVLHNANGTCWLPLASAYCSGYDPSLGGTQTITVHVLGVSCSVTLTLGEHTHRWSDATCKAPKTCITCGITEGTPLDHLWKDATCYEPKTCTFCGTTEGYPLDHIWADATCELARHCTRCNLAEGLPLGHNWTNASCEEPGSCTRCGISTGEATGHTWDWGVIAKEPTFGDKGTMLYTCLSCGSTRTEDILPDPGPFVRIDKPDTEASRYGFSYDIPENGVTVLIFFSPICGNSQSLLSGLNYCTWLDNPYLNVVAIDANSGSDKNLEAVRNTYTPDVGDRIDYRYSTNNSLLFTYFRMMYNSSSLTWPIVMVITDSAEGPVLRYGTQALRSTHYLQQALEYVSPAFASWDGSDHEHTWIPANCQTPKTCATCGATEGTAADHSWIDATCAAPQTCKVCGLTQGEAYPHQWEYATCTSPQHCLACGLVEGQPLDHTWDDATCTAPKTCFECGLTEGDPVPHDWEPATCQTAKTCITCGKTEGNAPGHNWLNATCEAPKTCAACGKTEGSALGHDWAGASCEEPSTCKRCGVSNGGSLGHSWNDATCEAPKTCATCGKTDGGALGHNWKDATCETAKTCLTCGKTDSGALGHDWIAATCQSPKHCSRCAVTEGTVAPHTFQGGYCTLCGTAKRALGDATGDGKATYEDALKILRASIALELITDDMLQFCDVDDNGRLDYNDALLILRFFIGLITEFPKKN